MADAPQSIERRIQAIESPEVVEAPQEVPQEVPQEAPQEAESTQAATEEPDSTEDRVEALAEESTEETVEESSDDDDDPDAIAVENYVELAQHINVEPEELYKLKFAVTTPDGQRKEVPLGEIKDSYQTIEAANKIREQAQQEYETLTARVKEFETTTQAQMTQAQAYIQAAQGELTQEFNQINWDQLRQEDPGAYASRRQDFIERNGRLQQLGQQAAQEYEQQQATIKQQREAHLGQYIQREQVALTEAVPEWRNEEAAAAEKQKVAEYLLASGYSSTELDQAYDHRAIVLARKAMLWDAGQKNADVAKKKVMKIGKRVLKSSSRQSPRDIKADREGELRAAMRKGGGKIDDAAALIQTRLGR